MNSGSNTGTTVQRNQLPAFAYPYAKGALTGMYNYLFPGGQMRQYPNPPQQVMGFTPDQIAGQNMGTAIAAQGSPAAANANNLAAYTEAGGFLNPQSNPYLQNAFNSAAQGLVNQYEYGTQPSIQSQFAQSGNFGSSAQADAQDQARFGLGQNLGNLANQMFYGNYAQERANQLAQQQMLPQTIQSQFIDPTMLQDIGTQQQQFGQQALNTNYQNMLAFNQWPFQVFQSMLGALGPAEGNAGVSVTQGPLPASGSAGLNAGLGGGLGALGLMNMMGGMGAGAAAPAAGGLFGGQAVGSSLMQAVPLLIGGAAGA